MIRALYSPSMRAQLIDLSPLADVARREPGQRYAHEALYPGDLAGPGALSFLPYILPCLLTSNLLHSVLPPL